MSHGLSSSLMWDGRILIFPCTSSCWFTDFKEPVTMSCLISCVPQPRGRGTVISTCCLKAMVHGYSWKTQKLYLCQIYILCPEKQIKPQLVWKLIRFFWVCDLFACICIDLTVYIHTFLFIPTLINIPFTCTDKFGSKKKFSSQSNVLLIFFQDLYLNCSYPVSLVTYAVFSKQIFSAFIITVGEAEHCVYPKPGG